MIDRKKHPGKGYVALFWFVFWLLVVGVVSAIVGLNAWIWKAVLG